MLTLSENLLVSPDLGLALGDAIAEVAQPGPDLLEVFPKILGRFGLGLLAHQDSGLELIGPLFLMVQGQTAELRRDSLALLSSGTR